MLKLGTVGTSWISEQFIEACQETNLIQVEQVYSRSKEKGRELASHYHIPTYCDSFDSLVDNQELDVIYIASPNHLHFEQTMEAIRYGKHVIIEKPMFSNLKEWKEAHRYAKEQGVLIFEAAKHIHGRNYKRLKSLVHHKMKDKHLPFMGANFNLGQFSSRYPAYRQAEGHEATPNVFNPQTSGGSLMDLGVYPLYVAVDLFGQPEQVTYQTTQGQDGSDLFGNIYLTYKTFGVTLFISKAVHSILPSEIYFDDEALVIYNMSRISKVDLVDKSGQQATLINYKPTNDMSDEVTTFARLIKEKKNKSTLEEYDRLTQLSYQVAQVIAKAKASAGLK